MRYKAFALSKMIVLVTLLLLAACAQVTQNSELESEGITKTFYVATTGNDASPGTLAQPFRT
ncbi:MAG: hypothetical protein ACRCYY_20490, partial [Trueperaceae bacterium]